MRPLHLTVRCSPGAHVFHCRVGVVGRFIFHSAKLFTVAGLLLFALVGLLFLGGHARQFYAHSQNSLTKELLKELRTDLAQQENQLDDISARINRANYRFGIERLEPTVIARGIGGPLHSDSLLLRTIPGHRLSHQATHTMATVRRGIDESTKQLSELEKVAQQKILSWRHYPSILPATGRITSPFGQRLHPITGENKPHEGLDIANTPWTPIVATADGVVSEVSYRSSFYGNLVRIDHGNGYQTLYAHLSQAVVKPGQFIQRHQLVGHMGSTGRVTGTHLHYEVRRDGVPLNPVRFILPNKVMVD